MLFLLLLLPIALALPTSNEVISKDLTNLTHVYKTNNDTQECLNYYKINPEYKIDPIEFPPNVSWDDFKYSLDCSFDATIKIDTVDNVKPLQIVKFLYFSINSKYSITDWSLAVDDSDILVIVERFWELGVVKDIDELDEDEKNV